MPRVRLSLAPARERNLGEPPRGRTDLQASGLAVDRLDLGDRSAALLDDDVLPPLDSPEMLGELRFELGDADRFHDHILVMSGPFANSSRRGIPRRRGARALSLGSGKIRRMGATTAAAPGSGVGPSGAADPYCGSNGRDYEEGQGSDLLPEYDFSRVDDAPEERARVGLRVARVWLRELSGPNGSYGAASLPAVNWSGESPAHHTPAVECAGWEPSRLRRVSREAAGRVCR